MCNESSNALQQIIIFGLKVFILNSSKVTDIKIIVAHFNVCVLLYYNQANLILVIIFV